MSSPLIQARRRADLQGLRAVAMLVVAVYHVWTSRVSGGVDVFLFLSAYFLTGSLVRRAERGEPLRIGRYWARTFSRLLAPAAVVIGATAVLVKAYFPLSHERSLLAQAWASLAYRENRLLAAQSTDYYSLTSRTESAYQQFWSLSVQGVVFLTFPLVIGVAAALARRLARRWPARAPGVRVVAGALFAGIAAGSFAWSLHRTAVAPLPAYFETLPRLWELALGSLLALALPTLADRVRLGPRAAGTMAAAGLLGLVSVGALLPATARFPGWVAALPLGCAALVVASGELGDASRSPATRLLAARPLRRLGDVSYGFYLWHWPVLVTYLMVTDHEPVTLPAGLALLAVSVALAALTHALVENPVRAVTGRGATTWRGFAVAAVAALLCATGLTAWQATLVREDRAAAATPDSQYPGAAVLDHRSPPVPTVDRSRLRPRLTALDSEWSETGDWCGGDEAPPPGLPGDCFATGSTRPSKHLWVIGDSHAAQLMGALRPIADEKGWRITILRRNACRFQGQGSGDPECDRWNREAAAYALSKNPDALVVLGSLTYADARKESLAPGLERALRPFLDRGIPVVSFRDNPRFRKSMAACVDRHGTDAPRCSQRVEDVLQPTDPVRELAAREPLVRPIDLTDLYCPAGTCPAVIGNVLVYLDDNHLTRSYVETTLPDVRARLTAALAR